MKNKECNFSNKDIIHIKNEEFEYLQFRKLKEFEDKFTHMITLRYGGVSKGIYSSLNFRTVGSDKKENVEKNLQIACSVINIDKNNVFKAKQNHTDNILIIDNNNKEEYRFDKYATEEADGYISNTSNIATLVTTADCNPIIIYDKRQNVYANVHSGWKGTLKQIYLKAIRTLNKKFNSKCSDLIVCIGPAIKSCCFSSEDEEFKNMFTDIWKNEKEYIYYEKNNVRFHIDLSYVIRKDLLNIGILPENIVIADICTKCNSDSFFSFRKATEEKQKDYGTMATIAMIR